MGHFLRDQRVTNLSLTEDSLLQISEVFQSRADTLNEHIPEKENKVFVVYIIRFDNKGYRVFSMDDLRRYFRQAQKVERVIFTVETIESVRSNRILGTYLETRLDEVDPNGCMLTVTSDDGDWVDVSFAAVQDVLVKYKNRHDWARTAWTQLGAQIAGVILGFVLSLWAAVKISPQLAIENSFVISFLFVLLIFSNTWTFINQKIISAINNIFPNLKFYRAGKDRMHWLMQAIIGGIIGAIVLYALGVTFSYLGDIIGGFIKKGT